MLFFNKTKKINFFLDNFLLNITIELADQKVIILIKLIKNPFILYHASFIFYFFLVIYQFIH
jgi:hypothetical protein